MSQEKFGHQAGAFALRQRGWLLAEARNLCGNDADAEDLVHDTFVRFLKDFNTVKALPPERACVTWLLQVLTNRFFDHCRKRKVQERGAKDPHLSGETAVEIDLAPRSIYDSITEEQFDQAVQLLSPTLRATYELHKAGMKYQDIARSLGVPVGTVSKRLSDARSKLRELLAPYLNPGGH